MLAYGHLHLKKLNVAKNCPALHYRDVSHVTTVRSPVDDGKNVLGALEYICFLFASFIVPSTEIR